MTITINGTLTEQRERLTLADILVQNGITADLKGVAVALNDEVVMKSKWTHVVLQDGDRIEIVRATQGG